MAATPMMMENLDMAMVVKMANGDFERFEDANDFSIGPDKDLYISTGQTSDPMGAFAPGSWFGAWRVAPKVPPPFECGVQPHEECTVRNSGGGVVHVHTPKPTLPADLCADPNYSCGLGPDHIHIHKDWPGRRTA
jgi:hypothetical protein